MSDEEDLGELIAASAESALDSTHPAAKHGPVDGETGVPITTGEAEREKKEEISPPEEEKILRKETIVTKPELRGPLEVPLELQKAVLDKLVNISERSENLSKLAGGRRELFEQAQHVVKKAQQREEEGAGDIFKGNEFLQAIKILEVYAGYLGLGAAWKATNDGTTGGVVRLPSERELERIVPGKGIGVLYPHFFGLVDFAGFVIKLKVPPPVKRFVWRDPDKKYDIEIHWEGRNKALITGIIRELGIEGWDQEVLEKEIFSLFDLKTQTAEAIGLEPYTDLVDRTFAGFPDPEAKPDSEQGGYDAFENHRREIVKQLVNDTDKDPDKSLLEKWEALKEEQRMEIWLRSYELTSVDLFEDLAQEMETERDERLAGRQKSRSELLIARGRELQEGKKVEGVIPATIEKTREETAEAKTKLENLEAKLKRLRVIQEGEEGQEPELRTKKAAKEATDSAYNSMAQVYKPVIDTYNAETPKLSKEIDGLDDDLKKIRKTMEQMESRKGVYKDKTAWPDDKLREEYLKKQETEGQKERSLNQRRTERDSLLQRYNAVLDKLAPLAEKKTTAQTELTSIEAEQQELLSWFNNETDPTKQVEVVDKARQEYEAKQKEVDALEKGTYEPAPEDIRLGEEIVRIGQIVGEKNAIKGEVDSDWLEELDILVQQQDWDGIHNKLLELIFESTGTADEKKILSRQAAGEILSKDRVVLVTARTLLLNRKGFLEAGDITGIDANTGEVNEKQSRITELQTNPNSFISGTDPGADAQEAIKGLQKDIDELRRKDLALLAKAFPQVVPHLRRNQVQTQRVVGALIDELYNVASTGNLRAIPAELQPTPIEKPPGAAYEAKVIIRPEIGKATYEAPRPLKHQGKVVVETKLPADGGATAQLETAVKGRDKIEVHVKLKADLPLYLVLSNYTNARDAINAGWNPTLVFHFFGGTSPTHTIRPADQVANNSFIEIDLMTGPQRERKTFDEITSGLSYGSGRPLDELRLLYPAAVAKIIYTEKDATKKKELDKAFAKFTTAKFYSLGVDYGIVFKDGRFLVTGKERASGDMVVENEPFDKLIARYKEIFMARQTPPITDETKLTPANKDIIHKEMVRFLSEVGTEALRALQR